MTDVQLRTLDRNVHSRVMGCGDSCVCGPAPNAYDMDTGECKRCGLRVAPHYSTDIRAAWLVVEKLRETVSVDLFIREPGTLVACYMNDLCQYGDTAPEAICNTALGLVILYETKS